jgi:ParB-like chromosome segregation protein Spo0J
MKVEMLALGAIVPYGKNPRRNKKAVDAVAASIKQFGWRQPIVVDAEKVIIVGHTRYLAAQKLGIEKVPVVVAKDLRPEQVKAYRIADNKTNELAEWDVGLLSEELKELSDAGWNNFSDLAFSNMEIDALLSPLAAETFTPERPTLASAAEEQATSADGEEPGDLPDDSRSRNYLEEEIEDDAEPTGSEGQITQYREDAVFPAKNRWGIPELRPDMLWDGDIKGVYTIDGDISPTRLVHWGTVGFDERMRDHVICFFADDQRFEAAVWDKAVSYIDKLKVVQPSGLVSPDFSLWQADPPCINLYNIYRQFWCARYWQEAGFKILPNIAVLDEQSYDYVLLGMPKRVPAAIVQARTTSGSDFQKKLWLEGLHWWCSKIECPKIFVYGGEHRHWIEPALPRGPKFVWIDSFHKARKEMGKC